MILSINRQISNKKSYGCWAIGLLYLSHIYDVVFRIVAGWESKVRIRKLDVCVCVCNANAKPIAIVADTET